MTEAEKLEQGLLPGTWGPVFWLKSVGSTNDYLLRLGDAAADGTVVAADDQTAGRGRRRHVWKAVPGMTLALSFLLRRPAVPPALSLLCGLAAAQALEGLCGEGFGLKWPNDIVCAGKKVGGVLCEARLSASGAAAVCGIGINLTQSAEQFRRAGLLCAASVRMLTGAAPSRGELAAALRTRLHRLLDRARRGETPDILAEISRRCVTLGRPVRVSTGSPAGGKFTGTALRLAPDGALVVRTGRGEVTVTAGEVSVRGWMGYV